MVIPGALIDLGDRSSDPHNVGVFDVGLFLFRQFLITHSGLNKLSCNFIKEWMKNRP